MATQHPSVPIAPNTDDATFQAWVTAIDSAITALGIVHSADTGQINPATVTRPAAGAYAGYIIYRFADALQATAPAFLKLEFGIGSSNGTPQLRATLSSGTNGAGTPSGNVGGNRVLSMTQLPEAGQDAQCYFSGDTGRLSFVLYATSAAGRVFALNWERSKAADGTRTGDAVFLNTPNWNTQTHDCIGAAGVANPSHFGVAIADNESTGVTGTDVVTFALYPPPRFNRNALHGLIAFILNDIGVGTQFSVDPDGNGAKTYIALTTLQQTPAGNNSNGKYAIRYD